MRGSHLLACLECDGGASVEEPRFIGLGVLGDAQEHVLERGHPHLHVHHPELPRALVEHGEEGCQPLVLFRVEAFGFRISGAGLQVSGFRFRV